MIANNGINIYGHFNNWKSVLAIYSLVLIQLVAMWTKVISNLLSYTVIMLHMVIYCKTNAVGIREEICLLWIDGLFMYAAYIILSLNAGMLTLYISYKPDSGSSVPCWRFTLADMYSSFKISEIEHSEAKDWGWCSSTQPPPIHILWPCKMHL